MTKFAYPESLVKEFSRWVVLVRPEQVTLGSLVLVCKDPVTTFPQISGAAFRELKAATTEIEACLSSQWHFQKINYLMLMMQDKDVHFHVIPRYDRERRFADLSFADRGWPGPPDLANAKKLESARLRELASHLRRSWP